MPLEKRKGSPYWQIRFQIAGIEVKRSSGTTDRAAAEELEEQLRRDLWRQIKLGEQRFTWDDAVAKCKLEDGNQRSWERKERSIEILNEYLQGELLTEITYDSILTLRSLLLMRECKGNGWKTKRTWKPSTVNRVLAVLAHILNRCASEDWKVNGKKMLESAPTVPLFELEKVEPVWATKEQVHVLLGELPEHSRDMSIFACATGLRRSNVTHLEWSRVNIPNRMVWVPAISAKGKKTIAVPLNDDAIAILEKWKGRHPQYVFCFRQRAPIKQVTTKTWHACCARAGLPPNFTFHSLRHCWASWQTQSGTPLRILMELGGWATIAMPLRYSHLAPSQLAAYADRTLLPAVTKTAALTPPEDSDGISACFGGKGGTRTLDPSIMSTVLKKTA